MIQLYELELQNNKKRNSSGEYEYGIYEIYYDDNGNIKGWTEDSIIPTCSSEENLRYELEIMKEAFNKETLTYEQK